MAADLAKQRLIGQQQQGVAPLWIQSYDDEYLVDVAISSSKGHSQRQHQSWTPPPSP